MALPFLAHALQDPHGPGRLPRAGRRVPGATRQTARSWSRRPGQAWTAATGEAEDSLAAEHRFKAARVDDDEYARLFTHRWGVGTAVPAAAPFISPEEIGQRNVCVAGRSATHTRCGSARDGAQTCRTEIVLVPSFFSGTGTVTVRTPSLYSAVASSPSAPAGSRTTRVKVP